MSTLFQQPIERGILIAPSAIHSVLRLRLLEEQKGSIGLTILSMQGFLKRYGMEELDEVAILCAYRDALASFPSKVYHHILHSLDFMKQCYSFIEEMKLYGISCEALSEKDEAKKEMKQILSILYPIHTPQDEENKVWKQLAKQQLSQVYLLDTVDSHCDYERRKRLLAQGAIALPYVSQQPDTTYFHAINKRKEIECAAQMVMEKKLLASDLNIIVCDSAYQPLLAQVFDRYQIPFTIMKLTKTSPLRKKVQMLLQYYLEPSRETLLELIELNTFLLPYVKEFSEYLRVFDKQLEDSFDHIHTLATPSELISQEEIERLSILEEHAQECKNALMPRLETLCQQQEPKALLHTVNELVCANLSPQDQSARSTLARIHELFVSFLPYFKDRSDLPFLIEYLEDIQENAGDMHLHGALISELHTPLPPRPYCLLVGSTQKLYPAFPAKSGLFDEAYVKSLDQYPSMSTRNHIYMEQLETSLRTYQALFVSYPIGNYDGKGNEGALEMEQFLEKRSIYQEPYQSYERIPNNQGIQPEQGKQLFLRDGKIYGSISAFETYMRCPFSYFLRYGLKIKEPIDYSFSQSRIGTLSHYVLETMVNRYQKEYPNAPIDEMEALLEQELQAMAKVYPRFALQLPILKARMLHSLKKNFTYLKEMEEHSHLAPFACEEEFWWDLPLSQEVSLCLHGFIDRIDASGGYLRIIDYKSSAKQLSEADVFAGLQLQLLTYALYARETWQKEVLGAFYYSLKNENLHAGAGKMSRRPVAYVSYGPQERMEQFMASKRLRGWTMHQDIDIIDDDGTHILGVRASKDGKIKARKSYQLDQVKEYMQAMYEIIGKRIYHGEFACSPTEDACMFCPYKEICRFQGYPRAIKPLVEIDDSIYLGGE